MTTWNEILADEMQKDYYQELQAFVQKRRAEVRVFPEEKNVFNALELTPFESVKVVILGQDPYHGPNQAHGLSFSVKPGIKPPPSLLNMYKELSDDIEGFQMPNHGYLVEWAQQGVLLLNSVLTVEQGLAHSHANWGWEIFTDKVIEALNHHRENLVFLLWGSPAQKKGQFIDRQKHCVLTSVHPSPLSAHRGFFGCRHFSKANAYLQQQGIAPINWQLSAL